MAIGDAFNQLTGAPTVNRQPAVGVAERISAVTKGQVVDAVSLYNGTNVVSLISAQLRTYQDTVDVEQVNAQVYNMMVIIDNTVYIRKEGTTDGRTTWGGVQVDA